jgi:hypothetical protein
MDLAGRRGSGSNGTFFTINSAQKKEAKRFKQFFRRLKNLQKYQLPMT